jgi:hypothetical protein
MEYYDDRYNPNESNDVDDDSRMNNKLNNFREFDRGYHKFFSYYKDPQGFTKKNKIFSYSSGICGSNIRCAETGTYLKYKVGSLDENLFFKMSFCDGKQKNGPYTYFYESPTSFEKHHNTILSDIVKEKWNNKQNKYIQTI